MALAMASSAVMPWAGGRIEVSAQAAPAGEGGGECQYRDGLVPFRAWLLLETLFSSHGEVAGEYEDLLPVLFQPAAERVAGVVPGVPVAQPVVRPAEGGRAVCASSRSSRPAEDPGAGRHCSARPAAGPFKHGEQEIRVLAPA